MRRPTTQWIHLFTAAATLGVFGLHHLYLGDRRRALKYLAFFWTAIPIVLGWIDAVRLALLDDAGFQKQLKPRTSPAVRPETLAGSEV